MQGPDAAECQERQVEIQVRENQLHGRQQANEHADEPKEDGRDGEVPDNAVVVLKFIQLNGCERRMGNV